MFFFGFYIFSHYENCYHAHLGENERIIWAFFCAKLKESNVERFLFCPKNQVGVWANLFYGVRGIAKYGWDSEGE